MAGTPRSGHKYHSFCTLANLKSCWMSGYKLRATCRLEICFIDLSSLAEISMWFSSRNVYVQPGPIIQVAEGHVSFSSMISSIFKGSANLTVATWDNYVNHSFKVCDCFFYLTSAFAFSLGWAGGRRGFQSKACSAESQRSQSNVCSQHACYRVSCQSHSS